MPHAHTNPRRVLFIAEATSLAHVARPYALASTLDPARYDVHFAVVPGRYADLVLADAPFRRWPLHRSSLQGRLARIADAQFWSVDQLERSVTEERELIQSVRPDLVVVDGRPGIAISAGLERVPSASITSVIWTDDVAPTWRQPVPASRLSRPYIPGLTQAGFELVAPFFYRLATRPVAVVRRRHRLPDLGRRISVLFEADHLLYLEPPGLFQLRQQIPATHHFLGAAPWSPRADLPPSWDEIAPERPLVYVGLGTSGSVEILPAILRALEPLPCFVAVATGDRRVPAAAVGANVFVTPYLPGDLLARRAAVVINNGGSPGVYQALSEGTPVLGIPNNLDQHRTMAALAWRGATLSVRSDQASASRLRRAVQRLLEDETIHRAAAAAAAEFARYRVSELFPRFVQSVVAPRRRRDRNDEGPPSPAGPRTRELE